MRSVAALGVVFAVLIAVDEASAGSIASLSADVDGDGTPDTVAVSADGKLSVGTAQLAIATQPVTKATLSVTRSKPAQILVDATTASGREAIVVERARTWHEVARFALGGVGLDREYSIEAEAGAHGVIRYQARADVRRCDGKPAYLFAERLEGAAWKRLDKLPLDVATGIATIAAKLDTQTPATPLLYQARAVSHQVGATDAGALAIPRELDDGRVDTAWREDLPSAGEGQFFTFQPRITAAKAQQLRIVVPAAKGFARPRQLIVVGDKIAVRVEVPDGDAPGTAYVADLPQPIAGCVTVILESVGRGTGPTAIAELGIYAENERTGGGEVLLARVVAEGKGDTTGAAAALARRGAPAAVAIEAELGNTQDPGARRRLVGALVKIKDPAAVASLVRAAIEGWVRGGDLVDVIEALAANGQIQALRDLAAKSGLAIEIRVAAVERLLPTQAGFLALVDLAGHGPRQVRHAVIERLALGPAPALVEQATQASAAPTSGDLWRAATRRAQRAAPERPAVLAAMLGALASASDYERRYRLLDGIATLGDAAALATLEAALRALPPSAQTAALRQVAIRALAFVPRAEGSALVLGYARDADPGVRLASITALGAAELDGASPAPADAAIAQSLASDRWPEIRRKAATALGARCQRPDAAKALVTAVGKDADLDVKMNALTGLVQCRAADIRGLLSKTWENDKLPPPVRRHAVSLVPMLGDMTLAKSLVKRFVDWRGEAIGSAEALELVQAAAGVLGLMNPPGAVPVLVDALDDSAFPEIVSAAALALGALGPACPAKAKAKLAALAASDDRSATVARRAAAQCGR